MAKKYVVELTEDERSGLMSLLKSQKRVASNKRKRAQVLLKVDEGEHGPAWDDDRAAQAFDLHTNTVRRIRRELVEGGLEAALERKKQDRPSRARKLEESGQRELLALAQSDPPAGRVRWTLHLLADQLVQLHVVDSICYETVRRALKKTRSNRTCRRGG